MPPPDLIYKDFHMALTSVVASLNQPDSGSPNRDPRQISLQISVLHALLGDRYRYRI